MTRRVLLTAHTTPALLDLAVAARHHLAEAGVDLVSWAVDPIAEDALVRRGMRSLFPSTLHRIPRSARDRIRSWWRRHRQDLRAGRPVEYRGVPLDPVNAYEARIRRASDSVATRLDLGRSAAGYVELFEQHLGRLRPDLLLLWWGEWAWSRVGAAVAERMHIPTLYFERGPFRGTAQLDPAGANAGSSLARHDVWRALRPPALSAEMAARVEAFRRSLAGSGTSGRAQPARRSRRALAAEHGIPLERRWLFFPAQETTDAVAAIEALGPSLHTRPEVHLVVKPHPREQSRHSRLARALRPLGDRASLVTGHVHDLIEAAEWTVTVSSSVGLEAALMGKPVLVLRGALYGGKGFTWDAGDYPTLEAAVAALLAAQALSPSQCCERDAFCHYLIADFLLWGTPERVDDSGREMAHRILAALSAAGRPPGVPSLHPSPGLLPPHGWTGEPTVPLSVRDAYRDLRDRMRRRRRRPEPD